MILQRIHQDFEHTTGKLMTDSDEFICWTLELPWKDNQRNVSCIPAGVYNCQWKRDDNRVMVLDVPERDGIQIHIGNRTSDIQGCILPGMIYDKFCKAVWSSAVAMDLLRDITDGNDFELEVKE